MLRVLILVLGAALVVLGPVYLTKEILVFAAIGTLTLIGLVRVVVHETKCASHELFPALTEIAEGYFAFKRRLAELRSGSPPVPSPEASPPPVERPVAEYPSAERPEGIARVA